MSDRLFAIASDGGRLDHDVMVVTDVMDVHSVLSASASNVMLLS